MASPWRSIFNACGRLAVVMAAALIAPGCQFDTSIELRNNPPQWSRDSAFRSTVRYPDSALCTLSVEDLNDTALFFGACFTHDSSDTVCQEPKPWPWHCRWCGQLPGTGQLCLTVDPCSLGVFSGFFRVSDAAGAEAKMPFLYAMVLIDSLNQFPLSSDLWVIEPAVDSSFVGFDFLNHKVRFSFPQTGDSTPASTGLCTRFALSGDLETSIQFQLRDDMREGFEVMFRISTSPLAGPWDGDKTGFSITGLSNQVRLTCFSVNMQTDSRDISRSFPEFAGYLGIRRIGDSVRYQFIPGDPQLPVIPMNKFVFPGDKEVYVHIRMSVSDRLHFRHCLWSDFGVTRGRLRF